MAKKKKSKKVFPASLELIDLNLEENNDVGNVLYNTKYGDICGLKNGKWEKLKIDIDFKTISYLRKDFIPLVITIPIRWAKLLKVQKVSNCFNIYKLKNSKSKNYDKKYPYYIIFKSKTIGGFNKEVLFKFLNICNYFDMDDIEKFINIDVPKVYDMSKEIIDSLDNLNIYGFVDINQSVQDGRNFQRIIIYKCDISLVIPPNDIDYGTYKNGMDIELFYKNKLIKCCHIIGLVFPISKTIKVVCDIHYFDVIEMIKIIISGDNKKIKSIFKKCINLKLHSNNSHLPLITLGPITNSENETVIEIYTDDQSLKKLPIPNKIRKRNLLRKPTNRFLQGKLNVKIIYPSGRVYPGRLRVTSDGLAIIEPSKKDRGVWICDLKDITNLKVIELNMITVKRVYHTTKNVEWLKSLNYIKLY